MFIRVEWGGGGIQRPSVLKVSNSVSDPGKNITDPDPDPT